MGKCLSLGFIGFLGQLAMVPVVEARVLTFKTESAVFAGNGCPQDQTRLSTDYFGDLYIEYGALAIQLPANGVARDLAQRKACSVRVPARLEQGYYIKSIQQQLIYGARKSRNATLQVASLATFSNGSTSPLNAVHSRGISVNDDVIIETRDDALDESQQIRKFCHEGRATDTMFQLNVVISGQRDTAQDHLVGRIYGNAFAEGIEIEVEACPAI